MRLYLIDETRTLIKDNSHEIVKLFIEMNKSPLSTEFLGLPLYISCIHVKDSKY